MRGDSVVAADRWAEIQHHPAVSRAVTVNLPGHLLLPAMVNAHCHLDLTNIGPLEYERAAGFVSWVRTIMERRPADEQETRDAVRQGISLSLAGGTGVVGDIAGAGSLIPAQVLRESHLQGTSFVEIFGMGKNQAAGIRLVEKVKQEAGSYRGGVRLGLQPHAPYSAGPNVYRGAQATRLAVSTHLAETPEERRFIMRGDGPFRELLENIGKWDDSITQGKNTPGQGIHPVEYLLTVLETEKKEEAGTVLLAHVNDTGEEAQAERLLRLLQKADVHIVYCPRANDYFHRADDFGPHRYRDMLRMGINVALGTDSIVGFPPDEADRISILDEMKHLYRRDGTEPMVLLTMATINGAEALSLPPGEVTFSGERLAGLAAVDLGETQPGADPLLRALKEGSRARTLAVRDGKGGLTVAAVTGGCIGSLPAKPGKNDA